MFDNRKVRTVIERIMFVNFLGHWVTKTFVFYLVIGVCYVVLILGQEKSNKTDWVMLWNIFGNLIVGVAV